MPQVSLRAPLFRGSLVGSLHVLIVEDDDAVRGACAGMAESLGCRVRTADSVPAARALLAESVDVVFLDMKLPGGTGTGLLDEIRSAHPRAFIVVMTAYATVSTAVDLMRNGAGHFLQKPFALTQVSEVLEAAAERRQTGAKTSRALQDRLEAGVAAGRLVGASEAMQKLFRIVSKVAFTRHPVLILGERGSGKEVVARAIHANGAHSTSPFVPVDCDALEPKRLESELFGEGSPGTKSPVAGVLAKAGDGTVFLAEIGSLDPAAQAKLVRALQDRQIRSTGGSAPLTARILASSSSSLEAMVEQGRFRKDLFYRLNVVSLRVPPLRERVDDIPLLAEYFLDRQRREHDLDFVLTDQAVDALLRYPWAGNVGELESLIERACGSSSNALLHLGDLSTQVKTFIQNASTAAPDEPTPAASGSTLVPIHELERHAIQSAMHQLRGDKLLVAKCLGIGKTTLYRKLKEYGIADHAA